MTINWIGDGRLKNGVFTVVVTDQFKSDRVAGYRLPDQTIEQLIEENANDICFVEVDGPKRGRYTISMEDWLDYRVWSDKDQWQHVSRSFFARG